MTEQAALLFWLLLTIYLSLGLAIALAVVSVGLRRFGPDATAMPLRVRVLVTPGLAVLWPLVLARLSGRRAKEDRR
jgi:hypothetical protein